VNSVRPYISDLQLQDHVHALIADPFSAPGTLFCGKPCITLLFAAFMIRVYIKTSESQFTFFPIAVLFAVLLCIRKAGAYVSGLCID